MLTCAKNTSAGMRPRVLSACGSSSSTDGATFITAQIGSLSTAHDTIVVDRDLRDGVFDVTTKRHIDSDVTASPMVKLSMADFPQPNNPKTFRKGNQMSKIKNNQHRKYAYILSAAALCIPQTVWAQNLDLPVSAHVSVTTFGAGIEGRFEIDERLTARAFYVGGLSHKGQETYDDVTYDVDAKLEGIGLLLDYRPTDSGWFISGGLFNSLSELNGKTTATETNPISVNGTTYNSGETGSLTVKFKSEIAPMLSTGYRHSFDSGWSVGGEVGAIFVGGVDIAGQSDSISQADLDAEIEEIKEDIGDINAIPFVGLKVGFTF